jgi:hypothetical protein
MRAKVKIITFIIIGLIILISSPFLSAIDAPHNESNNVYCGSCHGQTVLDSSPFWGGTMSYDQLCLKCHLAPSGPYSDERAPLVKTHSSANTTTKHGDWSRQCIDCHNPHYQLQKNYKNSNPNNYYLAKGTISSCLYSPPDPEQGETIGKSTLTYSTITYRNTGGTVWDATKLTQKTSDYRRTILFPNINKLGFNYPITAVDTPTVGTITVSGNACTYLYPPTNFAAIYGQYIKDIVDISADGSGNNKPVKLFDQTGTNSLADGDTTYNGICEVCHTQTIFHTNNASGDHTHAVSATVSCTFCHSHSEGLKGSGDCIACHSSKINGRAAITPRFNSNSHHVQGVTLTNEHCYQCHWEANSDGSLNNNYHMTGNVDLVIYGEGTRPTTYSLGETAIQYSANGSRAEIKKINAHCLSCHSAQNDTTKPFGDDKTPKQYAWDGSSIDNRYSQTGTTTWGKYGNNVEFPIINESFEKNTGYDDGPWTETGDPDEDSVLPSPLPGAGSQCMKSSVTAGTQAFAKLDHGAEIKNTLTSFYLYVEDAQGFSGGSYKPIAIFENAGGANVILLRLYYVDADQLQFNLRIYNDSGWQNYFYPDTGYISLNTWYKIEIKYDDNNNAWEWRVNGITQPDSAYNNTLTGGHYTGIQKWNFGFIGTGVSLTGTIYYDLITVPTLSYNFTPKNTQTKSYSAHGNAISNDGGWDLNETWTNTRAGTENIACFDCHNSHGSSVSGTTASYTSVTTNGGILKNTAAGTGGYSTTYKPQAGGSTANKNVYNAGSGLCFDCHMNANAGTTPWGYQSTFKDIQAIMGYKDTPYFGPGSSPSRQRFAYKIKSNQGGHFGASSTLSSTPTHDINGLCTSCHDPHGVTNNTDKIAADDKQYAVPLLKGTWLTSPYKEDRAPSRDEPGVMYTWGGHEGINYYIDQNTFGSDISYSAAGVKERDTQFAGLCLNCHPKGSLTDGTNGGTWKSVDRIHESVKGWGSNVKHNYPCSKCHAPHNSRLPRLMVTNCLDTKHKGFMGNNTSPTLKGNGNGEGPTVVCYGEGLTVGPCPEGLYRPEIDPGGMMHEWGNGNGHIPGSYTGQNLRYNGYDHKVTCHEDQTGNNTDQGWNNMTTWTEEYTPEIISGPVAGNFQVMGSSIWTTVTWVTRHSSTSYVDYGLTSGYGFTNGVSFMNTNHSVTLTNLINHTLYHYRVRSTDGGGTETVSGDYTFITTLPPSVYFTAEPDTICPEGCAVTLQYSGTDLDGGTVEFYIEVDDASDYSSPNYVSGWMTDTSWTVSLSPGTWYWRVKGRDAAHPEAISSWRNDSFIIFLPMPAPTLIDEPDVISSTPVSVSLEWSSVTSPDGDPAEYYVSVDDDPNFGSPNYTSNWISATNWAVTVASDKKWYWRVKARDSNFQHRTNVSDWSNSDSFNILLHDPPPAPTLISEPDIITTVPTDVTLQWWSVTSPDGDPVDYYVEVDNAYDFSSPYTSDWISGNCAGNVCSWTVNLPPGYWCWRVKARDNAHTTSIISSWSTTDYFNTMQLPPAPTLIDEPNIVSTSPVTVTLQWNQVTCPDGHATEYSAVVNDTNSWLGNPKYASDWIPGNCVDNVCSWEVTVDPAISKTWYWRVQAKDTVHTQVVSLWSTVDSFVLMSSNPPPAPTLIDEADISTPAPVAVTLEWYQVTDPDGDPVQYYVCVSQLSNFFICNYPSNWISGNCVSGVCNWTATITSANTWYWRVQARDQNHTETVSDWSNPIDSFATLYGPPPSPILIDEPDVVSADPVTLEWNEITCPDGDPVDYRVQLDDTSLFSSINYDSDWITGDCVSNICKWTVSVATDKRWYWKVRARDSVHTTSESSSTIDNFILTSPPLIDESFEGAGYEEFSNGTVGSGCTLDPDAGIPGTPPSGSGSQCLQSISASTGFQSYAIRNLGSEQPKTFTSFYVYVGAEGLGLNSEKNIASLKDNGGNDAVIFKLFKGNAGNLRFRFSLYNNGVWYNSNSTAAISLNNWYKIDIRYDNTGVTVWEWRLDGITQDSGNLSGTHRTGIQTWTFGFWQSSQTLTGTIYFDLIKANISSYP